MACKLNRSGEFATPDQFNDLKSGAKGRQDRQNGEQATERPSRSKTSKRGSQNWSARRK